MPRPTEALLKRPSITMILRLSGSITDSVLPSFIASPEPSALQWSSLMPLPMKRTANRFGKAGGDAMKLGKTLSVMEPLKRKIIVIDGLFNKASVGLGIHPAQTGSLLSGVSIQKGAIIHSGVSIDQIIASAVGEDTAQSSIVLACEQPMTGYHETNYSLAY